MSNDLISGAYDIDTRQGVPLQPSQTDVQIIEYQVEGLRYVKTRLRAKSLKPSLWLLFFEAVVSKIGNHGRMTTKAYQVEDKRQGRVSEHRLKLLHS